MQYAQRLDESERKFDELTAQMADPAVINDNALYRRVSKAQSELTEVVAKYRQLTAGVLDPDRQARVERLVLTLDDLPDLSGLVDALAVPVTSPFDS